MTLLQKIKSLTWWSEVIKLKDILQDLLSNSENLEDRIEVLENSEESISQDDIQTGATLVSMDGIQTIFNIPHGMSTIPTSFSISFGDAGNLNFVQSVRTISSTSITLTCVDPPTIGSQTVYWQVYR